MSTPTVTASGLARFLIMLFTVLAAIPATAQPAPPPASRFLLVFDTSSAMKKRLPNVQRAVDNLLAGSIRGQLHPGDTIGVWTFGEHFQSGEFPLQFWQPQQAAIIASNINQFVAHRHFTGKTTFPPLMASIYLLEQHSERLTVFIFCDGDGEMTGTTYDEGVNQVFETRSAERKKTAEPFVIVLRSFQGRYVGCALNLPPDPVLIPDFPPLPPPLVNTPPPPPPAPTPAPVGPPLVIVGTTVEHTNVVPAAPIVPPNAAGPVQTNVMLQAAPASTPKALIIVGTPPPPLTNRPPPLEKPTPVEPVVTPLPPATVAEPAPARAIAPTNPPVPPTATAAITASNNTALSAPTTSPSGWTGANVTVIVAAIFVFAAGLIVGLIIRARRADHASLITRSMNIPSARPPPPDEKR